jgi:predicted HAD superfamily phosphohydrolase YqeG
MSIRSTIENYRPDESKNIADYSSADWATLLKSGVEAFIFDAEGTLANYGSPDIEPDILKSFDNLRAAAAELELEQPKVFIATNKSPKKANDYALLQYWGDQIDATAVVFPQAADERKKGPYMPAAIMERYDFRPDQVVMFGDKLTADVASANYASSHYCRTHPGYDGADIHIVKVEREGPDDHPGDRVRRVGEAALQRLLAATEPVVIEPPEPIKGRRGKLPRHERTNVPGYALESGRLANVGSGPKIELSAAAFDQTMPPYMQPVYDVINKAKNVVQSNDKLQDFAREHGRVSANILTRTRGVLAIGSLALGLRGHKKLSMIMMGAAYATDFADGILARKFKSKNPEYDSQDSMYEPVKPSENEPPDNRSAVNRSVGRLVSKFLVYHDKIDGAKEDPLWDKVATASNAVLAYRSKASSMTRAFVVGKVVRDIIRGPHRKAYYKKEYTTDDTKATPSSKMSTAVSAPADIYTVLTSSETGAQVVQAMAFSLKVSSMALSAKEWRRRKKINDRLGEIDAQYRGQSNV